MQVVGFMGIIWLATIIGWIANIIQLIGIASGPVTTIFVLKCVGIFAFPLGAILGWFGFF